MAKKKKTASVKKKATKASRASGTKKKAKATKKAASAKKRAPKKSELKKKADSKKSKAKKSAVKKAKKSTTKKKSVTKKLVKKKPAKKKSKASLSGGHDSKAHVEESYVEPEIPKTKLSDKQLTEFRQLLLDKRRELLGDVRMLTRDALGKPRQESSGDLSNVPIHMADVGSDNWEQDFTIGLIANERQLVREIDDALERIQDRTYGICLGTFKRIAVARLRAKPWAKYSIEYARELEQRRR